MIRKVLLPFTVVALAFGCGDSNDPSFSNPFDPKNGLGLPVPDSLVVRVGNNLVRLQWGLPDGETAESFAVFRRRTDAENATEERLLARTSARQFDDTGARNGRTYEYTIAAGRSGQFGQRSDPAEARPGLFAIVIENDVPQINRREVSVTVSAPGGDAVRLSEDPSDLDTPWRPLLAPITWTLSEGDGDKTLYGAFLLTDGSQTIPSSDAIRLDTHAVIGSVGYDGTSTAMRPGDTVHFTLDAGEPGGSAEIDVEGLFAGLELFDDGSLGDPTAGDGVYERDATIPAGRLVTNVVVTGRFTDAAGNVAPPTDGPRTLSVRDSPEAVDLIDEPELAEPPDAAAVTLRWTQSSESDFASYQVFRSEQAPVDSASRLVGTVAGRATLSLTDRDVVEGRSYLYRVYVATNSGLQTGSNVVAVNVPNLRPPAAVRLDPISANNPNRLTLSWTRSTDLDFARYRVYRNEDGAVGDDDVLVVEVTDVDQSFWDDSGLQENTTYYYRVYTDDEGGLSSRSGEVDATTKNEAPEAVALSVVRIDSMDVELSWTASTAHDFSAYRIYRDETPTVTSTSTFLAAIDEEDITQYVDTGLEPDTDYWYRVFVVDDGDEPESSGSNVIAVTTKEDVAPEAVTLLPASLAAPPDPASATLRWTASEDDRFAAYRLFRSETLPVDSLDTLVGTTSSRSSTEFLDDGVAEGRTYHYRVFVLRDGGAETGSNPVTAQVTNLRRPEAVALNAPVAVSASGVSLSWSPSGDLDFSTYVVFRSETGVVTTNDVVVGAVDSVDETFLDDDGLVDNTAYYYRVFTFDEGGLLTPSNVVSALTKNEPPPGVQLTVTDSDSVSATFEWTATSVHDFDLYRLYRNTNSAVTTGSTLVAEINDADVTTFRDLELSTGTEYFYRLFVVDDGVDPGPEATGSNTVSVLPAAVFRKPGGTRAHDISETR